MKKGIASTTIPDFLPAEELERYRKLTEEKKRLEEEIKSLGSKLTSALQEHEIDKLQLPHGSYSVVSVPRYSYSDLIHEYEETLKKQKAEERETGKAKVTYTSSLRYTPTKK